MKEIKVLDSLGTLLLKKFRFKSDREGLRCAPMTESEVLFKDESTGILCVLPENGIISKRKLFSDKDNEKIYALYFVNKKTVTQDIVVQIEMQDSLFSMVQETVDISITLNVKIKAVQKFIEFADSYFDDENLKISDIIPILGIEPAIKSLISSKQYESIVQLENSAKSLTDEINSIFSRNIILDDSGLFVRIVNIRFIEDVKYKSLRSEAQKKKVLCENYGYLSDKEKREFYLKEKQLDVLTEKYRAETISREQLSKLENAIAEIYGKTDILEKKCCTSPRISHDLKKYESFTFNGQDGLAKMLLDNNCYSCAAFVLRSTCEKKLRDEYYFRYDKLNHCFVDRYNDIFMRITHDEKNTRKLLFAHYILNLYIHEGNENMRIIQQRFPSKDDQKRYLESVIYLHKQYNLI